MNNITKYLILSTIILFILILGVVGSKLTTDITDSEFINNLFLFLEK